MRGAICLLVTSILLLSRITRASITIPAPNGTYTVGWAIAELKNTDSIQPFAPEVEVPALMLSVFYPTDEKVTVTVPYMDRDTAIFVGQQLAEQTGLASDSETFQLLSLQLAKTGSRIAEPKAPGKWPVLIFGCALGTSRLFYSALLSQIASTGYVVVAYDTPYDTDIVVYPDGQNITANKQVAAVLDATVLNATTEAAILKVVNPDLNVRAQDASFIITSFNDSSYAASMIPGCSSCLNTTHVGYFGHSVGGAAAATLMRNDTRVVGGIDFDGAIDGLVVEQGLDRPFMLMAVTGQTREGAQAKAVGTNWAAVWAHLRGPSFDLIFNNALHYTYSDYPLILQLLGLALGNQSVLNSLEITNLNGTRAHHIVTTYAVTFFDWLLKGGSNEMLKTASVEFPEISIDTGDTEEFSNGTVVSATNGTVIRRGGSGGVKNSAAQTSTGRNSFRLLVFILSLVLIA